MIERGNRVRVGVYGLRSGRAVRVAGSTDEQKTRRTGKRIRGKRYRTGGTSGYRVGSSVRNRLGNQRGRTVRDTGNGISGNSGRKARDRGSGLCAVHERPRKARGGRVLNESGNGPRGIYRIIPYDERRSRRLDRYRLEIARDSRRSVRPRNGDVGRSNGRRGGIERSGVRGKPRNSKGGTVLGRDFELVGIEFKLYEIRVASGVIGSGRVPISSREGDWRQRRVECHETAGKRGSGRMDDVISG